MASPSSAPSADTAASPRSTSRNTIVIAFLLISALYFADTLLRASLKTFWYDELATVFLCRLPSFHATWTAVLHGSDFNPPLFYLLTRWGQHFSGEGLIASRLPAIIGFWVFGVCLFVFVTRRLGPLPACIAALFPVFTLAHVYAYEARPHGATLAWSGLMLVGWQHARQGRNFSLWTLAFWLSWLGALLTHVYAVYLLVPFLAVEALGLIKEWRPHLGIVISMLLGPICVAPLYLRMAHTYRSATSIGGLHIHPYEVLQQYLVCLVGPGIVLLLLFLLLVSFERLHKSEEAPAALSGGLLPQELWLAVLLGCLPLFGAIGVKLSHGPFFNRYFLSATAGYAILLAQAAFPHSRRSLAVKGLVAAMLFLLTSDLAIAEYCRWHHADLDQVEPASLFHFPLDSRQPLSRDAALLNNHFTHDILVPEPHLFLYLYYYASPELRQRLYLGILTTTDFSLAAYRQGAHWAQLDDTRFVSFDQFFATHSDFFLYNPVNGNQNGACYDCLQPILNAGYTLRSVDRDTDNLLEHFSK